MIKKKSLGQYFLHNAHYLRAVADAAHIQNGEVVLEIGPGDGALTAEMLLHGARVVAIEKDRRLIPILAEKFKKEISEKKLEIVEGDALHYDISKKVPNRMSYKLVANIPYYITGALLKKFLSALHQPSLIVFLVQKEVAERIARSRKESILSLSVQAYGEPKYIKTVPRGAFSPAPTVDSAILGIYDISKKNFSPSTSLRASSALEKKFFELVRAGFAQKRKLVGRNLEQVLGPRYSDMLGKVGIPPNARAEDISLAQWVRLASDSLYTYSNEFSAVSP